jgi:hypothetical protein
VQWSSPALKSRNSTRIIYLYLNIKNNHSLIECNEESRVVHHKLHEKSPKCGFYIAKLMHTFIMTDSKTLLQNHKPNLSHFNKLSENRKKRFVVIFTPTACSLALRKLAVGAEPSSEKCHAEFISASLSVSILPARPATPFACLFWYPPE